MYHKENPTRPEVGRLIDLHLYKAFEHIDDTRELSLPSEVEEYLERAYGLGEMWRDWWQESGEEYK